MAEAPTPREARQGFAREQRLAGARCFARVFAEGSRSRSAALLVIACPSGLPTARLGLAIGRKHLRRAVDRNRVKRRIRESFRKHQARLRGLDVVVVGRPALARLAPGELDPMLETQWTEIVTRLSGLAPDPR